MWQRGRRGKRSGNAAERCDWVKCAWLYNIYQSDQCSDGSPIRPTPLIMSLDKYDMIMINLPSIKLTRNYYYLVFLDASSCF